MDSVEYAIYRMAHGFRGGVTALAQHVGVRAGTLTAKVDPANEAATTNVRELVAMLLTTGDYAPLAEIARLCGYTLTPVEARDDGAALLDATLEAGEAHGALMARTREALRDGEIDRQELTAIREAATAATMAAEQMVASAAAAAEATTARRVRPIKPGRAA